MNSLDREVKQMMLQYPSIMPNRMKCLEHLFVVIGNGYEWKNGILVNICDDKLVDQIKPVEDVDWLNEVELNYRKMIRKFTEENIDYLCTRNMNTYDYTSFLYVYPASKKYSRMSMVLNPENIDIDWIRGIREFILWFLASVNGYYRCSDDGAEISDGKVKLNYLYFRGILKLCNAEIAKRKSV